jgi:hypothetical protein
MSGITEEGLRWLLDEIRRPPPPKVLVEPVPLPGCPSCNCATRWDPPFLICGACARIVEQAM